MMFEFQVYSKSSRRYVTVATGSQGEMILNMTLPHMHDGARRRVRVGGKVLVRR